MNRQVGWRRAILLLLVTLPTLKLPVAAAQEQSPFDRFFEARTMRVDYYHTGSATQEIISLERAVSDGAWAGSRTRLIDDLQLGKYFFEVTDAESGQVVYSRGFCSIYGEWETTGEARTMHRTFHESLRFPWPKKPVRIVLQKRGEGNAFQEIWSYDLDPGARWVNSADPPLRGKVWTLFESGPPSEKVDIVLLGEGYTEEELPKFHADARRLTDELFSVEPFKSRRSDFNVRAIDVPAAESGISRPHAGKYRRNPVGTQYSIFDSERYVLTYDNRTLRDVLAAAPYDFVAILVNEKQYGGGGIYNFHMTAAVDSDFSDYVFVHEFGHHFAGLADEYYTSDVAYETGGEVHPEPWELNVTALHDPERLKWRDLVQSGTPIPTPWDKEAFEEHGREIRRQRQELIERGATEAEFDGLFQEQRESETRMLAANEHAGEVGAFEGAMYESVGLYRPEIDCIMFSRNRVGFCRVCRRAIERMIDFYIGK
ncbi:MAG: IgA Peptidase M64 [Gemmatimonadota bacterium]|nr:MAG: IgA Peptidase M64 [Gemmatimonadota bacterium]